MLCYNVHCTVQCPPLCQSVYKLYSCARRFVFLLAAEFLLPDHLVSLTTVFNSLKENTVSHKEQDKPSPQPGKIL